MDGASCSSSCEDTLNIAFLAEVCDKLCIEDNVNLPDEDINSANVLLSLAQHQIPTVEQKTYADIAVQVDTPREFIFSDFIKTDSLLYSLTALESMKVLDIIVKIVGMVHTDEQIQKLSVKQRIILTFIKLKWNLSDVILAVFFNITPSLCRTYISQMIMWLGSVLKVVIPFPAMGEIRRNTPICFKDFQDTQIVLHCIEICTETPKCIGCRVRFYSPNKAGPSVKFIIGTAPAGLITFVSRAYGGRACHTQIFEDSKLINKLEKNTAIMVEKGFLIDDFCAEHNTKLYRQLTEEESSYNKKIVEAHQITERAIQQTKLFKILNGKIPWSLVQYIEEILTIICAVSNMSQPLIADNEFLK